MATQIIGTQGGKQALLKKNDNDVVIVAATRSALTKGGKGGFKDTYPEEYLAVVLKELYTRAGLDPKLIEDIAVGNVTTPGGGAMPARMAGLSAGIPDTCALNTVNRQCSSSLAAVSQIANEITAGIIDIGIGAGFESMTKFYGAGMIPNGFSEKVLELESAQNCLIPMGITSENVAKKFGITREEQDSFAAESFQKAAKAQKEGLWKDEITPVTVSWTDPKSGEEKTLTVDKDDGIREGTTKESLGKLRPAFSADGTTTAGSSSQVSDGAAGVLLARRSVANKLKLPIIGKWVGAVAVGVPPEIMGIGPAVAIPALLKKVGISKDDVDIYEINEAFASQALYSIRTIGLPFEKVNPQGGAIAIGHPLGTTGARQIATGLSRAKKTGEKLIVSSMCVGSGMGMASLFVNEQ